MRVFIERYGKILEYIDSGPGLNGCRTCDFGNGSETCREIKSVFSCGSLENYLGYQCGSWRIIDDTEDSDSW